MTPNQEKWLQALESGDYHQGKGQLACRRPTSEHWLMCCLGVGCELVSPLLRVRDYTEESGNVDREYDEEWGLAPAVLRDWLGLHSNDGFFLSGPTVFAEWWEDRRELYPGSPSPMESPSTLVEANDAGVTFAEIAAFCRAHPEEVFQ